MSQVPSISVVIAYHDEPKEFVRECLQSLVDQTFDSWDCVLVNDASRNDFVSAAVSEIQDDRFTVVHHDRNRGLGAARNTGIRATQASLVALLDADDRLDTRFLELTHRALRDRPKADWVVVDWQCFGTTNDVWPFPIDDSLNCPAHFLFVGSGTLMRRSIWTAIGGYSEEAELRGGEDWDFWLSAAEREFQPVYLPRALYQYRTHPEAMTFTTARFANYRFRKAINRRHRKAFRTLGLDCPQCPSPRARVARFLAQGLVVSSHAFLESGQPAKGIALATRAFLLQPTKRSIRRHLLRSLIPVELRARLRRHRNPLRDF
jgi:glycosyltransferase involved in cell wall biosynthesis